MPFSRDLERQHVAKPVAERGDPRDEPLFPAARQEHRDLQKLFMIEGGRCDTGLAEHDRRHRAHEAPRGDQVAEWRSRGTPGQSLASTGPSPTSGGSTSDTGQQDEETESGLSAALPRGLLFGCSFAAALWALVAAVVAFIAR